MSKYHCKRCGKKLTKKFNPYNITFHTSLFNISADGDVAYCQKCAQDHVNYHNKLKGGHWILGKNDTKQET